MNQKRGRRATTPHHKGGPMAERIAARVTEWVGSSKGMTAAVAVIVIWAAAIAYSVHQYVKDKAAESADALHREFEAREAELVLVGGPTAAEGAPDGNDATGGEPDGRPTTV